MNYDGVKWWRIMRWALKQIKDISRFIYNLSEVSGPYKHTAEKIKKFVQHKPC
jgi:hypothetical protein